MFIAQAPNGLHKLRLGIEYATFTLYRLNNDSTDRIRKRIEGFFEGCHIIKR